MSDIGASTTGTIGTGTAGPGTLGTAAAAEPVPPEVRRAWRLEHLLRHRATSDALRARFGLPAGDGAIARVAERVADRFWQPDWAGGCIGLVDAMFLYDLIAATRPARVIELGVASGASSALLLLAMHDAGVPPIALDGRASLRSFDLHRWCYFDRRRAVGSAVEELAPELAHGWELTTSATSADAARALAGAGAPLAFIDADHRHPWPAADVLTLQPALAPGAWIALHDIDLPAAAAREERRTGRRADWAQRGAKLLFDCWPFEKFAGVGEGSNIGAIRLPADRPATAADLGPMLNEAWECEPPAWVRGVLGLR